MFTQTENGTNGRWQVPFVFCKRKTETANFGFVTANGNGKWKFVFLGQQMINGNTIAVSANILLCFFYYSLPVRQIKPMSDE
jgi:hypothetical protein